MTVLINKVAQSDNLIATALCWLREGRCIALITLVNIEGNAPYPIGTQMLVADDGEFVGQISGGCVEQAIAEQAKIAIQDGKNQTYRYGLDSPFFDIQLPCGSGIDVFVDVHNSVAELQSLQSQLDKRQSASQTLVTDVGDIEKIYLPVPRLMIAGQGSIFFQLAKIAELSGFETVCFTALDVTDNADVLFNPLPQLPKQAIELRGLCDASTALVSLFHEHQLEIAILKEILESELFYIGALGSRRTQEARLKQLANFQVPKAQLDRIHGPVGLDIKASTPKQIAISIMADIIRSMPRERA